MDDVVLRGRALSTLSATRLGRVYIADLQQNKWNLRVMVQTHKTLSTGRQVKSRLVEQETVPADFLQQAEEARVVSYAARQSTDGPPGFGLRCPVQRNFLASVTAWSRLTACLDAGTMIASSDALVLTLVRARSCKCV